MLSGRIVELDALRHTPAGVAVVGFRISHQSTQSEAGGERKVECELAAVAFEREARLVAAARLGGAVKVTGFIAAKGRTRRQPVLHATSIEFIEETAAH